ncbi:hypothetical protein LCGC14_3108480 [marine sediment metagenome]|uniref:Ferrous iron transporter FeoA-like domain-containing protein n=1 Tax=marine sediment metagenome TaxID=412755 RepID=A0A0F8W5Y9_9ZZZZ
MERGIAGMAGRNGNGVVGRPDRVHQLEEFGLRDGTRVQMFRKGNPCILRVAGNKVCFRADELIRVLVKPVVTPD